jgi:hypothetical protein
MLINAKHNLTVKDFSSTPKREDFSKSYDYWLITPDETYMEPTQFKYVVAYFNSKEIKRLEQKHTGFTENYNKLSMPK